MPNELSAKHFTLSRDTLMLNGVAKNSLMYTLVFFRAYSCPGCQKFAPIFSQIEAELNGALDFASIDVAAGNNRSVVAMARKSKTPIPTVPHLLLYLGNQPFARYTGNLGKSSIRSFLNKATTDNRGANTFTPTEPDSGRGQQMQGEGKRGGGRDYRNGYAMMGGADEVEEDLSKLRCPTGVIPHNAPWEGSYKRLELELTN